MTINDEQLLTVEEESIPYQTSHHVSPVPVMGESQSVLIPYTLEELNRRIDESEVDYAMGKTYSLEQVLQEMDEILKVV